MKLIKIGIIVLLLYGCKEKESKEEITLENEMSSFISKNLDISNHVNIEQKSNTSINIHFITKKSDSVNSFFLDEESNNIIIAILTHKFHNNFDSEKDLVFKLSFDGYREVLSNKLTKSERNFIYEKFQNNKLFHDFALYTVKDFKYLNNLKATEDIKYLNQNFNEIFEFNGTFWELLEEYSNSCDNKKNNLKSLYHFVFFVNIVNNGNDLGKGDIEQAHWLYYLNKCYLDENVLTMSLGEVINYIDSLGDNGVE
ncbi:hypothetical protein [Winogradskyella sp. 3972H.M.0a.05]|uniref:hypothetical protein n=1 Tax=Winogradskyella sp. 3972H.M.0a.05 TaxID=2950277 RepID=UPI00339513FD